MKNNRYICTVKPIKKYNMKSIFEATNLKEFKSAILKKVTKVMFIVFISSMTCYFFNINAQSKNEKYIVKIYEELEKEKVNIVEEWKLSSDDVVATVYNAMPEQCNKDFGVTASMFYLDLYDVEAHKIIAMERTFMKELGLVYGDVIKIEGVGKYDGVYQIQDTTNKKFKGQHKIDILVNDKIKYGKWNNVKIYTLINKSDTSKYTSKFKSEITKEENKKQMKQKRKDWKNK